MCNELSRYCTTIGLFWRKNEGEENQENGSDRVIEEKKKKKSEKKSLYLDENPVKIVLNDQRFEENGYENSAGGGFHYRNPNESE